MTENSIQPRESGGNITANTAFGHVRLVWNVISQSVVGNTSTIKWQMERYASSHIASTAAKRCLVVIDGETVFNSTVTIGGSGTKVLASGTKTLKHDEKGYKKFGYSFSQEIAITWSGSWIGTVSSNGANILPTIPRNSTITSVSGDVIGQPITVNINRAVSTYTHQVWYKIGDSEWFSLGSGHGASCTFTIENEKASHIVNGTSAALGIRVRTFSGSTQIGSDSYKYDAKVNVASGVLPVIKSVTVTDTDTDLYTKFKAHVQNKSRLNIVIQAEGIYGSSIKSYETKVNGETLNGSDVTTGIISTSGSIDVVVTVTDSRGRKAATTVTANVLAYISPTIHFFRAVRADKSGAEDDVGTNLRTAFKFNISSLNNRNDKNYKIQYRRQGTIGWTNVTSGSVYQYDSVYTNLQNLLHADYEYVVRLTVSDYFSEISSTVEMPSAYTLIDFHKTGRGLAFGKVAKREREIEFGMKFYDRFDTVVTNGMAVYGGSDEAIDPDTTMDELILTDKKTPDGMMYIRTMFYQNKSAPANRAQTAMPYNSKGSCYHRYFYNGTWSSWRRQVNADEPSVYAMTISHKPGETVSTTSGKLSCTTLTGNSSNGKLLHSSGGGIKIGAGVKTVIISYNVFLLDGANTYAWYCILISRANGTEYKCAYAINGTSNGYTSVSATDFVVNVDAGDEIYIWKMENNKHTIRSNGTYLTVKVAE